MSVSAAATGAGTRSRWLPWLAASIVAVTGTIGLSSLWPMLDDAWSNIYGAFSHGYLVLGLCIWLGIRHWRADPPARLQASWLGVLPLLGLVLVLIGMDILFLNSTRLALLPLVFLAAVALTFGGAAARTLFWPSVFLYFALPQWWAINGVLQSMTSAIVSSLVTLTGLPAYVEGNFIHVPAGIFEIASGCSGLNYLVAALSLAGFYALMYLTHWKSRLILLAAAAALAMLSNFVRIYALIVIGIASDMQHYLIRVEHLYFGWILFIVSMVPMLLLARRLDEADAASAPHDADVGHVQNTQPVSGSSVLAAAVVAGLLLLLPGLVTIQTAGKTIEAPALPEQFGNWRRTDAHRSSWQPAFIGAAEERVQYALDARAVELYRGTYPLQTSERRLIRTDNDVFGHGWRLAEQHPARLEGIVESRGYLGERERLIWSWYVVAGRPTATKAGAKLLELRGFVERRRDAAVMAVATDCVPDCVAARTALEAFMQESAASLR